MGDVTVGHGWFTLGSDQNNIPSFLTKTQSAALLEASVLGSQKCTGSVNLGHKHSKVCVLKQNHISVDVATDFNSRAMIVSTF